MKKAVKHSERAYHIGVFGHYGHDNMGDEAIIEAVIHNLRARCPNLRLSGFSMNAQDTARRYGIPAYPIRQPRQPMPSDETAAQTPASRDSDAPRLAVVRDWLKQIRPLRSLVRVTRFAVGLPAVVWRECAFLRQSYRICRDVDCLIVAGSNQFLDNFGGVWGFPYTLLKWTIIARCTGARVIFLSVGAGPIDSVWSRVMVRVALSLADYVSFRDHGSRRLIEWFGSGKAWYVYPDLAQSLPVQRMPVRSSAGRPVVGINPMPVYDRRSWCEPNDLRYAQYVGQLARFASRLLREGYPVFFFGTQPSDEPVIDDVIDRLDQSLPLPERRDTSHTVAKVMDVIGAADIVVPTRYHGTVLSVHARRPVLGICYYRKTREVLESMGQGEYAVDLDSIDDADLWRRFEKLATRREEVVREMERCGSDVDRLLSEQYDLVLERLGAAAISALSAEQLSR